MKKNTLIIALVVVLVIIGIGISTFLLQGKQDRGLLGDIHTHADIKVYLEGEEINLSLDKYMSTQNRSLSPFMHLHDNDGDVVHQHISDVTIGYFFDTLNMTFNETCFVLDTGQEFCNTGEKKLRMLVNGVDNTLFGEYEYSDLDRILITYGTNDEKIINQQINSVTDKSCIQSGTCPERGEPSDSYTCLSGQGCVA